MEEREEFIDFTVPYYDVVGISILMKKYEKPTHMFMFMTPFHIEVWIVIVANFFFTRSGQLNFYCTNKVLKYY